MKKIFYSIAIIAGLSTGLAKAQTVDQDKQPDATMATTGNSTQATGMMKHNIAGVAGIQVTFRRTNLDQINNALNLNGIPSLNNSDIWLN